MGIKNRIQLLLEDMNKGVYEKESEIGLSLLAALSGESILLLGPPGVAKSMVARRLKRAFVDAHAFEYLMSRFSTPDEIFGPVSISRLKNSDTYERVIEGYLPTSDVVFLDEIWKAGPAIQNTLLTVINEKLFRNGEQEIRLPLKLLVAASNELPAQGEGLEALWDRFLIRVVCTCISDEEVFYRMLLDRDEESEEVVRGQISDTEYVSWQQQIASIGVPREVLACITEIRQRLQRVEVDGEQQHRNVYISDRRWKKIVKLMRTSAFVHDRCEVSIADVLPVYHCLWNEPGECEDVRRTVINAIFADLGKKIQSAANLLKSDLKVSRVHQALEKARLDGDRRDDDLAIVDHFYYQLEDHGTGNTFIYIVDFKQMKEYSPKDAAEIGVMYRDPTDPKRTIIRTFSDAEQTKMPDAERVTLYRDDSHLYINGVRFAMHHRKPGTKVGKEPALFKASVALGCADYGAVLEAINKEINERVKLVSQNIFVTQHDKDSIDSCLQTSRKEIAWARVDAEKLMNVDD